MSQVCINCQKPKVTLACGICANPLCKKCAHFVEEDHFKLMPTVPSELTLGCYCGSCFDQKIAPALSAYDDAVEKAKKVLVFYADDIAETRLFRRDSKPIVIENVTSSQDVFMRMAYAAVVSGYNTLIDVQTSFEKVRTNNYQTSKWKGRGVPVKLDSYKPNRKSRFIGNSYKTED